MLNKMDTKNCTSLLGIVEIGHFLIIVEILKRGNFLYSQMNVDILKEYYTSLALNSVSHSRGNELNY